MFYINTQNKFRPIKDKQLLDALLIPIEERPLAENQKVYMFFANNPMLNELQRTKSLNARIKCIASMILILSQQFDPEKHINMHQFQDMRMVVLPLDAKQQAEAFDQKFIRKRMDRLNVFTVLRTLKYDGLLYLASNMEQCSCKYKSYLYKEGDEPDFCYFIEEGEFHYSKNCQQSQKMNVLKRKLKADNNSPLKKVPVKQQSPNKQVRAVISKYQVGIVEGRSGQVIGMEELILQQQKYARTYSVLCNSTDNKLIKIHKRYLEVLFSQLPQFHDSVLQQVTSADSVKNELYSRIKITKSQLKEYLKRSNQHYQKMQKQQHQSKNEEKQGPANDQNSALKLPIVQKRSAISMDHRDNRSKGFSSALGSSQRDNRTLKSLKSESNLDISQHRYQQQQDEQQGFGITAIQSQLKINNSKPKLPNIQQNQKQEINQNLVIQLPAIGKKSITNIQSKGQLQQVQEQRNGRGKTRLHSYAAMIDSSQLVEQKQQILNRKMIKNLREDIFPLGHIQYKEVKRFENLDPMKLRASPAHSNRFMEKLLLKVLKKAGYDEVGNQVEPNQTEMKRPAAKSYIVRSDASRLSKGRRQEQNKSAKKEHSLLVNSAFDECYFNKM